MIFTQSYQALTHDDIVAIETMLGLSFPSPVQKLYLSFNGGIPDPYIFENADVEAPVSEFLPLICGSDLDTSVIVYQELVLDRRLVSKTLFPFAIEGGGDYFFVDTSTTDGTVYLLRHDTADLNPLINLNVDFEQFWTLLKKA